VKGLVDMHGGTVAAQSAGSGLGSMFTVNLPLIVRSTEPASAPFRLDALENSGRRILVVDDNRDGADSLAMMLRLMRNQVETAYDGLAAIDAAEKFRPNVILMDVGMPKLSGLEAAKRIRERDWGQNLIIIALTGWGQEDDRIRSREAGCDGHLVKPVDAKELGCYLNELKRS
jgi:CheY-like chemotaxis protein